MTVPKRFVTGIILNRHWIEGAMCLSLALCDESSGKRPFRLGFEHISSFDLALYPCHLLSHAVPTSGQDK